MIVDKSEQQNRQIEQAAELLAQLLVLKVEEDQRFKDDQKNEYR